MRLTLCVILLTLLIINAVTAAPFLPPVTDEERQKMEEDIQHHEEVGRKSGKVLGGGAGIFAGWRLVGPSVGLILGVLGGEAGSYVGKKIGTVTGTASNMDVVAKDAAHAVARIPENTKEAIDNVLLGQANEQDSIPNEE